MDSSQNHERPTPDTIHTIVRLGYDATIERACQLAGIDQSDVDIVQRLGEEVPKAMPGDFRIISFDGSQITISERINGERKTRGFAVDGPSGSINKA